MLVGWMRFFSEKFITKQLRIKKETINNRIKKVAMVIPAHNEEKFISQTLNSAKRLLPEKQIFVVSDGSTDRTVRKVQNQQCNLLELKDGIGKARALKALINNFKLTEKFDYIIFLDAEVRLNRNFLKRSLRFFETQPKTAAIAGYVVTPWGGGKSLSMKKFIVSYRIRLNQVLQMLMIFGQTWRLANSAMVIPGGCSIYRASVLKKLKLDTPGILIEDFNLAFQVHKKKLGKIAHDPKIFCYDKEPRNLQDYWRQVKRWNTGYFQTIRKQGIWLSAFWIFSGIFTLEVLINAVFMVLLSVFLILFTVLIYLVLFNPHNDLFSSILWDSSLPLLKTVGFIFAYDYLFSIIAFFKQRKALILFYGLGFLFIRLLDSLILLASIKPGFFSDSSGIWKPPERK